MKWQQFLAILKLRWHLTRNQLRRAGIVNRLLMSIILVLVVIMTITAFVATLVIGTLTLSDAEPDHLMFLWDGMVVALLFFWSIGVMTELQRSEVLSLDRLLHLPVSLSGAFILNYGTCLTSVSLLTFVPAALGLCLALIITHGPRMILLLPLILGFVLLVTALTYQFRGWLSQLMQNKRRRGTVVALTTLTFVMLMQVPNLANIAFTRQRAERRQQLAEQQQRQTEQLNQQLQSGQIDQERFQTEVARFEQARLEQNQASFQVVKTAVGWANVVVPFGWLPYGARAVTTGDWPVFFACSFGLLGSGSLSLWLAYRGTVRAYMGMGSRRPLRSNFQKADGATRPAWVGNSLPWVGPAASTVALANFRSLTRSPEAKMMLMTPCILIGVFGSAFAFGRKMEIPEQAIPFFAMGAIGIAIFSVAQWALNLFGSDHGGFRSYILLPVPRRDLLLGKNLSLLPVMLVFCLLVMGLMYLIVTITPAQFVATLLQSLISYLLFCIAGNQMSVVFPIAMAIGSRKPQNVRFGVALLQGLMMVVSPVVLLPALIACGVESLVEMYTGIHGMPIYLLLTLLELPLVAWLYFHALHSQGRLLQRLESKIVQVVATANE
jgi:hypothetical protein